MSPSEFDLRSALRDGEGDGPDPDAMLAAGRARASARRTRIAGVTGAVVAILAVGTTGAVLLGRDGGGHHSTAGKRPAAATDGAAASSQDLLGRPGPTGSPSDPDPGFGGSATNRAAACPSTFPGAARSTGSASGLAGSGALFGRPVASVLVCGYGSTGATGQPGTLNLLAGKAGELVASLEAANTRKPSVMCPDYRTTADHRFAFVGVTADGTALTAVTTTVGGGPACDVVVTNGSAYRYAWEPPADLVDMLYAVAPR